MRDLKQDQSLRASIIKDADQCVRCAKCLPHCPTYQITENECESPRGRIALLQSLAQDEIQPTAKTVTYLDHCLVCRACEAVCPAEVKYGQLIDQGRMLLHNQFAPAKLPKLVNAICLSPTARKILRRLTKIYQSVVARQWPQRLLPKKIRRYLAFLTQPIAKIERWHTKYSAHTPKIKGSAALFTGCITDMLAQESLNASIFLLNFLGFLVYVPKDQVCCGALFQHTGQKQTAAQLQNQNLKAFRAENLEVILTPTSGCAVVLEASQPRPVKDPAVFFAEQYLKQPFSLPSCKKKILIHIPCTMRNVMRQHEKVIALLEEIPNLQLLFFKNHLCCGAAGVNMLVFPDSADQLGEKLMHEIIALKPDIVLDFNIGCELHLAKLLSNRKINTQIQNISVFLANLLQNNL